MSKKKPKSRKKLGQIRLAVLVKARRGAQATFDTRRLKRALAQAHAQGRAQGGSAALDEEVEAGAVVKQEAAPPAMPAGAVVKVEAAPPLIVPGRSSGNTKRDYKAEYAEQQPRQP